jgi:hypothetical protein
MGCGDSDKQQHSWNENTSSVSLQTAGAPEVALREAIEGWGGTQQAGLNDAANFAANGDYLALSPQSQATLDKAFDASRQQLELEGKDYADFLSGSRGLRMSDTPISQQALQRYGLGLSALESQRAMAGLNLGLNTNLARQTDRLNLASTLPGGTVFGHNAQMNNRLAQPTTHTVGTGNTTVYNNPSLLEQMNQGAQFRYTMHAGTNQATQAGSNMMGMGMFG